MENQYYDFFVFVNSVKDLGIALSKKPLNLNDIGEESGIIITHITCIDADDLFEKFLHKYCYSFLFREFGSTILYFDPLFCQQDQILKDTLLELKKIEARNKNREKHKVKNNKKN
jgi:hypothetical protein